MSILDELNEEQRKAAERIEGPVLILAGAGSGKTRTVTYKIAYMINELDISPYNILALTFTNKAAKEMKERAESLVKNVDTRDLVISTFHSFAVRLLKMYADRIGYGRNFNIYDTDDQKSLINKIIKALEINLENITPGKISNKISKLKEDGISVKDLPNEIDIKIPANKMFYEIYLKYEATLKANNAMDFSDLLVNARKLLDDDHVRGRVQERYKYVIVDEYQDTNRLQYEIINIISNRYKNICVVGDEDQSIYAFRGANIENILNFEKDYPNAFIVKLEKNYRSTQRILNVANEVIRNNKSSKGKKLWTDGDKGEKVKIFNAQNTYDEASFIAENIVLLKNKGIPYKSTTILYRTNAQSRILEEKMMLNSIPYRVYGGMQFFQRKEIKDILGYFSLINNPNDDLNFLRIINAPKRSIGEKSIEKISELAQQKNISLFDSLGDVKEIVGLRKASIDKLTEFYNILKSIMLRVNNLSIKNIFDEILDKTKYIDFLTDNKEDRVKNIEELLNSIIEMERIYPEITLSEYLDSVSLSSSTDDMKDGENFVKLMTVHSSKGLEFDYVFVAGMEDGLFPSDNGNASEDDIEEERRLCYVAVTRARKELFISHASERMIWGQTSYMRPHSRFIDEMKQEELEFIGPTGIKISKLRKENTNTSKIENFNPFSKKASITEKDDLNAKYKKGAYVTHIKFGKGKITNIDKKSVTVNFITGEKKIALVLADKFFKN